MQYTDNEAALIGGLISNYFFQPSVDAKLRESYRRVLCHLHEDMALAHMIICEVAGPDVPPSA